MSNPNIQIKARRMLELFTGMRKEKVTKALLPFGFNQQVMKDGLERLFRADLLRMDGTAVPAAEPQPLALLGEFENTWFPIARAVLEGSFPDIAAQVFLNLSQQQGREVTLAVAGFLARLAELSDATGRFGADGPKARALLSARGLTAEREAEAHGWLEALTESERPSNRPRTIEEREAALDHAWLWYLEWSAIARVAIKDKVLRRKLGFLKRRAVDDEDEEMDAPVVTPVTPPAATPALPPPAATQPPATPPAPPQPTAKSLPGEIAAE